MSFDSEMCEYILKYLLDKYPGRYEEWTIDQIMKQPRHKRVWAWWEAHAHFRHEGRWFNDPSEAPPGIKSIKVMDGKSQKDYYWVNGKYEFIQEIDRDTCKSIYGND